MGGASLGVTLNDPGVMLNAAGMTVHAQENSKA